MRIASNRHNVGVDLTRERETAIDLEHARRDPERGRILALLEVKIGDHRNLGQWYILGSGCSHTTKSTFVGASSA